MARTKTYIVAVSWAVLALSIILTLKPHLDRIIEVIGVGRVITPTEISNPEDFKFIEDTVYCEDLHYHEPIGLIFTACADNNQDRHKWFPPSPVFDDPVIGLNTRGSLHVIDPKTFKSSRLEFKNFEGTFAPHGIGITSDPNDKAAVFIFAVNHVPHLEYVAALSTGNPVKNLQKGRSIIEVFHHRFDSGVANHLRSIYHPLIRTPNDIYARSPSSIFITNDHYYREGHMRKFEDIYPRATWTDTVHVAITDMQPASGAAHDGIRVTTATSSVHNNNGIAQGRNNEEVIIADCIGGKAHIGSIFGSKIYLTETIINNAVIDNPSYFNDPYGDKSGVLLPSVARVPEFASQFRTPNPRMSVIVNFATPKANATSYEMRTGKGWKTRTLFQDNGDRLSSVSTAVLVPIPLQEARGADREAWLFASGFFSKGAVAVRVQL